MAPRAVAAAAAAVLLALAVLAASPASAVTTVNVLEPAALRQLYVNSHGVPNTAATFGEPSYSASLTGVILHATPGHLDGCELNQTFVDEERKRLTHEGDDVIILVDRGDCSFSTKVRNVQNAGGVAAIVANNMTAYGHRIIMRPDNQVEQPDIPSVFISKQDGDHISEYVLNETRTDPVVVRMTWGLPHPDGRVEWRLWTTSVDRESVTFKREYEEVAAALGNRSEFDVGYLTFRNYGRHAAEDCFLGGRYCANVDLGADPGAVYTGRTIVRENLRQACVHRHGNKTGQPQLWWRYVNTFEDDCYANLTEANHVQCSEAALRKVGVEPSVVTDCIAETTSDDNHNSILDKYHIDEFDQLVRFTPLVMVNEEKHRGSITCPSPARLSSCLILKAICAGFSEDSEPEACVQYGDCPLLQRPGDGLCDVDATDPPAQVSGSDGVSVGTVVGIVLAVVVVVLVGVVLYVRRQRQQMRIDLDSILSSYMPVDSEGRPVPQEKTRIPQDEESAALM